MVKFCIAFLLSVCCLPQSSFGQTYRYKRVMIVDGGVRKSANDDAHYITFNSNGLYESDKSGYATGSKFVRFVKDANGLHCYYGNGYFGNAHYYFSSDYSRLNVRLGGVTYVYQRTTASDGAQARSHAGAAGGQGGTVVVVPPAVPPSSIDPSGGDSGYKACSNCGGSGRCRSCGGSGKMRSESIYTDGHTIVSNCPVCGGTGNCGLCFGSGRLRTR